MLFYWAIRGRRECPHHWPEVGAAHPTHWADKNVRPTANDGGSFTRPWELVVMSLRV